MTSNVTKHHSLEAQLHHLRLLRDMGNSAYSRESEDALLDEMEAVWYAMIPEEQRLLDAQRAVRFGYEVPETMEPHHQVDVDDETRIRRGLPPRRVA